MDSQTFNEIVAAQSRCAPAESIEQLEQRFKQEPRCPITNYLLGCHGFDRGRCAHAVRHMMTAHHAEPAFESAALLVFAGLNWISRRGEALLPVLLDTWVEFRRPEFDRHRKERRLLDAFDKPLEDYGAVSPVARRLWRLPIGTLRVQIREVVLSQNAERYPLLLAPA